ncbi:hypothetical protein HT031_006677 [Scenedesmus sp. PABB004]|nr:hypothetical protein HT031_006677 [Scenedesmus sp. PABB004]
MQAPASRPSWPGGGARARLLAGLAALLLLAGLSASATGAWSWGASFSAAVEGSGSSPSQPAAVPAAGGAGGGGGGSAGAAEGGAGPALLATYPGLGGGGDALMALQPAVHGRVAKAGMAEKLAWSLDPKYAVAREAIFADWRAREAASPAPALARGEAPSCARSRHPPAPYHHCHVFVNHDYRVAYIRSPKSSSTSIMNWMGQCRYNKTRNHNATTCMEYSWEKFHSVSEVRALWGDYFVFGFVRNPWARAYSLWKDLSATNHFIHKHGPRCALPWAAFCADPWAGWDALHEGGCGHVEPHYAYWHMMDQARCMLTDSGDWAVDFLGRVEHGDEDWATVVAEMNARRRPGVPEVPFSSYGHVHKVDPGAPPRPRPARRLAAAADGARGAAPQPAAGGPGAGAAAAAAGALSTRILPGPARSEARRVVTGRPRELPPGPATMEGEPRPCAAAEPWTPPLAHQGSTEVKGAPAGARPPASADWRPEAASAWPQDAGSACGDAPAETAQALADVVSLLPAAWRVEPPTGVSPRRVTPEPASGGGDCPSRSLPAADCAPSRSLLGTECAPTTAHLGPAFWSYPDASGRPARRGRTAATSRRRRPYPAQSGSGSARGSGSTSDDFGALACEDASQLLDDDASFAYPGGVDAALADWAAACSGEPAASASAGLGSCGTRAFEGDAVGDVLAGAAPAPSCGSTGGLTGVLRSQDDSEGGCRAAMPRRRRAAAARRGRGGAAAVAAAALLLLAAWGAPRAAAYSLNPFQGQGVAPAGSVKIYLTVLLERVLGVDQRNYGFEAITYFYMSWHDPRAKEAVTKFSKLQNDPTYNSGNGCIRFCDNAYDESFGRFAGANGTSSRLCCDGVWLPGFGFRNAHSLPEGRVEPLYAIVVAPDNETVTWRLTTHGTYFTPMDFHAFPFDSQDLIIELSTTQATPDKIVVVPSATSHKLFVHGPGDDLSTWRIVDVSIKVDPPLKGSNLIAHSSPVSPDDPSPQSAVNATPAQLANSVVPPLYFCVTKIHIKVQRLWTYYLFVAILPVLFLVWVAHVTFFMGPTRLNDRVSVLITLMLALVALQWVINENLPDSSYLLPTSQLVLLSYACLGMLVGVSVGVYQISMYKSLRKELFKREAALNRLHKLKAQLDAGTFRPATTPAARAGVVADPDAAPLPPTRTLGDVVLGGSRRGLGGGGGAEAKHRADAISEGDEEGGSSGDCGGDGASEYCDCGGQEDDTIKAGLDQSPKAGLLDQSPFHTVLTVQMGSSSGTDDLPSSDGGNGNGGAGGGELTHRGGGGGSELTHRGGGGGGASAAPGDARSKLANGPPSQRGGFLRSTSSVSGPLRPTHSSGGWMARLGLSHHDDSEGHVHALLTQILSRSHPSPRKAGRGAGGCSTPPCCWTRRSQRCSRDASTRSATRW